MRGVWALAAGLSPNRPPYPPAALSRAIAPVTRRVKAWQCIGCGRVEGLESCIGVCQDRPTEFVYAAEHDLAIAELRIARQQAESAFNLLRQLVCTSPRTGEWERSYRAMRARARAILEAATA